MAHRRPISDFRSKRLLPPISHRIATELSQATGTVHPKQVEAAIALLDEGATVPFVARYRKEVTGGLDDAQLRLLDERLGYLRELEERRAAVIKAVDEQGKLSDELKKDLLAADTKTRLEDLYLPYKKKRRTRAQIAREAGLEPLARALLADPALDPEAIAVGYVDASKEVADAKAALDGARQILMEEFAEDAELAGQVRDHLWDAAKLKSEVVAGKENEGAKFSDYFAFDEDLKKIPSHRALALLRGRNEGVLSLNLDIEADADGRTRPERMVAARFGIKDLGRAADRWLNDTVRLTWRVKLLTRLETELVTRIREAAEEEAIAVFARNLHDLLLAAPAGPRATLGLDPGLRTGVKVAVVDRTGKVVDTATVYPHVPRNEWDRTIAILAALCSKHGVDLIAIGNGTASRETDKLAAELMKKHADLHLTKIMVSEAGASVYSASELASNELPELDVSLRGAVSIARRLQDPLAELVKIDPKSIGVGQYQHDVSQLRLARSLDAVVEDCVNAVGVDVNTASPALLARVSGLSATLAASIVAHRDAHGAFADRAALKAVPRLGDKTFEQAAGFLRINGGANPLDASAVHPEAYPVVERILARTGKGMADVLGDSAFLKRLNAGDFVDDRFGLPTVRDIISELDKPGRDPRPEFKTANFQEGVEELKDLREGMILEGVVTNVTNFGAFVDIGVHQDGLVHISALSDRFVKDPHQVVKAGDVVKVKVMQVDLQRKRVGLSMRLNDDPRDAKAERPRDDRPARPPQPRPTTPTPGGSMADAFARARKR
ncbi:MAG: RNA-binding transcriptional accessory protein [Gammaproteobacteria bacterium]|nr:RNA-binding transcriptional accessory protein [Gammaproteobacteria bacterium]